GFSFRFNGAHVFRFRFKRNPTRLFWNQIRKFVGPFNYRNAVAEKIIVQAKARECLSILQAKEIEMEDRPATAGIFMNDRECRAGNGGAATEAGHESLHKLRFTAAEVALERQNIAGLNIFHE